MDKNKKKDKERGEKKPYEKPEIIHEGEITSRAGSLIPGSDLDYDVDPAKLFGGGGK